MESCCFTGHRESKLELDENGVTALKNELIYIIGKLHKNGVTDFYTGLAKGVDLWAAQAVIALKESFPIRLHGVVPFDGQAKSWPKKTKAEYDNILNNCDTTHIIQPKYSKFCFLTRNRYMVDNSNIVFAVFNGAPGGTKFTLDYAKKKNKKIIILNPSTLVYEIIK